MGPVQGRACGVEQGDEPTAPSAKDRELSVKTRPAAAVAAQMSATNRCAQEEILRPDTMYIRSYQ